MGYTHYWTFKSPSKIQGRQIEIENKYQLAVRQCQRVVKAYNKACKSIDEKHPARLSGYSAHTKMNDYLGLEFNGTKELSDETFVLRDHWSKNEPFNFCKTAAKPYDVVVVACLIVMQHYLGAELLEVSSDGDASEWRDGLALAKKVLKIKDLKVPDSVRVESPAVTLELVGKTFN